MLTKDDKNMVCYFLKVKGDITRWCDWENKKDEIFKEYPDLEVAFRCVEIANDHVTNIIEKISESNETQV